VAYEAIIPGEYQYSLLGGYYRATGVPDQSGTLRCRRYHLYELVITLHQDWDGVGPTQRDLGD
jgi:hypothetical protein